MRALSGVVWEMKASSPASYELSIRYHRPKKCWRAELCDANLGLAELAPPNADAHPYSKSLLPEDFGRRLREEESRRIYGVGEASAGDSVVPPLDVDVPVEDSVVEAGLVASVVAAGGLVAAGLAAGSVVSVFCSHAARSAALARMQIYFFIVLIGRGILL